MTRITRSRAGVKLPVHGAQILPVDVRVDLGPGDVGISKDLAYRPKVRSALEQVRGEAVPQRVGRHVLRYARLRHVLAKDLPRAHARQWPALRVQEEHTPALAPLQPRP